MADLPVTPARVALLADIDAGRVTEERYTDEPGDIHIDWWSTKRTKVTAKVGEMKAAGWCQTDPADEDLHQRGTVLTDAGRLLLARTEKP